MHNLFKKKKRKISLGTSRGLKWENNTYKLKRPIKYQRNRMFSRDVLAAMLMSLNKGMAAMLVSPTNSLGIELYYHGNVFFCFGWKN